MHEPSASAGPARRHAPGRVLRTAALASLVALLAVGPASADPWPWAVGDRIEAFTLEDQHGVAHTLDASVAIVLFSRDMDGGDLLKEALSEAPEGFLGRKHAIYVSDISGMPGLIARMFAVPAMRSRPYAMWLDRDGGVLARLPDEEGKATLIFLEDRKITRIEYSSSVDDVRGVLGLSNREDEAAGAGD